MSSRRTERLVNLVLCLLATRQYLTASRIRSAVPGYEPDDGNAKSDEAFKRMFERDKAELRDLGIPLETGRNSVFDTEDGYRIARRHYELPDVELTPDEAAAVGLATRLWQSAGMAQAARGALLKLRAAGMDVDTTPPMAVEPRVEATDEAFEPCLEAVRTRRVLTFPYRTSQGTAVQQRTVQPWGVISWRGRWYLVGHDELRQAVRCFRLSRIAGPVTLTGPPGAVTVPDDVNLVEIVAGNTPPQRRGTATLRVRRGTAAGLRRWARVVAGDHDHDHDTIELDYWDPEYLADRVVGHGADAIVLDPPEVRDMVVRRLRQLLVEDGP